MITTPFVDLLKEGRVAGYTAGALLVLGGGVNFASSFGTPPPMKAWKAFRRGEVASDRLMVSSFALRRDVTETLDEALALSRVHSV
ncbi:MAG: hypothetical protein HKN10_01185 [Myxococcales bacterium]|nr:hypothetical protein [Myxococcales bacterium]